MTIANASDGMTGAQFDSVRGLVHRHSGISLGAGKESLVQARIQRRLRALSIAGVDEYLQYIAQDAAGAEIVHLLDAISTNVTSFFRGAEHFDFMLERIQKLRAAGQSRFRIWSAAASSGEEPYTIAMTSCEALGSSGEDLKILATDISTRALAAARAGVYPLEKAKPVPGALRERWMKPYGDGEPPMFAVPDELKRLIAFRRLNLSKPPFPMNGPFDIVFCRNVMIYFDIGLRRQLVDNILRLLRPGGLLFVGHAESLTGVAGGLRCLKPSVYQKP